MSDQGNVDHSHAGNWHVLVSGLPRPSEPITLAPGITVVPLPAPLDVFDLAAVGSAGFREWAALEPVIRGCTCEIESAKDSDIQPGFDTMNRAWLAMSMLVLRGYSRVNGVAASAYSWGMIPIPGKSASWDGPVEPSKRRARTDLPRFKGGLLDFHLRMLHDGSSVAECLSETDAEWLRVHFSAANQLVSDSQKFYLAMQAAVDWRFAKDMRSAIAHVWSGIEAIFGVSAELVYRISLTAASLLTPRGPERKARFKAIKKLYGLRSKAVHGSNISDENMDFALSGSSRLLRELLILTVEKGHVLNQDDFDKALFE